MELQNLEDDDLKCSKR